MTRHGDGYLSKRCQQIMELVYERGSVTATDLEAALPGQPSNSTVRTQLRILEDRGHLKHDEVDGRFVYSPTRPREAEATSAMQRFLKTFFDGSVEGAFATLLSAKERSLTQEELDRLSRMIEEAREAQS
jgi:predicted transcriptional regulator